MDAKISGEFWSDPAIEALSAEQRMAALWCITSSRTTLFGFVEVTQKRFEFETGTPYQALLTLSEAHAKGFIKCGAGIWIRRFIAHQFGTGIKLVKNNFAKGIVDELRAYEGLPVFNEVLSEYPELTDVYDRRFHSDTAPLAAPDSKPLDKGLPSPREEQRREEESREAKNPEKESLPPTLLRAYGLFRRQSSTPLDAAESRAWQKKECRAAVEATMEADWLLLEWWFKNAGPDAKYRRKDLATLLNNWNAEIERARVSAHNLGVSVFVPEKKEGADFPDDWKELLLEEYPGTQLPDRFTDLPPSLQTWVLTAAEKKEKGAENE